MAKEKKMARVRYEKDEKTGREKYHLEIWDNEWGEWTEMVASRFVADGEHPGSPTDFIHYSLLLEVINLVQHGYEIDI